MSKLSHAQARAIVAHTHAKGRLVGRPPGKHAPIVPAPATFEQRVFATPRRRRRDEPLEADQRRPGETWWQSVERQRQAYRP